MSSLYLPEVVVSPEYLLKGYSSDERIVYGTGQITPKADIGGRIPPATEILIFEGNYLLLDESGWRELHDKWHASVWLEVPTNTLKSRLIRRCVDHGLSDDAARERAERNDMVNASRAVKNRLDPTWLMFDQR